MVGKKGMITAVPRKCGHCGADFIARNGAQFFCSLPCGFWAKVDIRGPDECWPWKAGLFDDGYGAYQNTRSNRYVLELKKGAQIERGMEACHTCDNPPCCNPRHLFEGTTQDNRDDCVKKRRHSYGRRQPKAKLTEAQVIEIRALPRRWGWARDAAKKYGVSHSLITKIGRGLFWRHVP